MIFNRYCEFLASELTANPNALLPEANISRVALSRAWDEATLRSLTQIVYDVRKDDAVFRREIGPEGAFDAMRKNYWDRREYSAITISGDRHCHLEPLSKLGFQIEVTDEPSI